MIIDNKIYLNDLKNILNDKNVDIEILKNKTIFITGATGLIGSLLVNTILYLNKEIDLNCKIKVLVRDKIKAKNKFDIKDENVELILGEVTKPIACDKKIDYFIHCAAPTRSKFFITNPVETIDTMVIGTKNALELAKKNNIEKFIYLSSMEEYGTLNDNDVTEDKQGYIDVLNERSSYSMGKRMAELLAYSYYKEYNVPIVNARLAMCFGPGIDLHDNRVIKYFCDCVINNKDIEIKSTGQTLVNFVYTMDAISAILVLLKSGKSGEAYNINTDLTDFTILDIANYFSDYTNNKIKVSRKIDLTGGYAPENHMKLNNSKIKQLNWNAGSNIQKSLVKTLKYIEEENNKNNY